MGAALHWKWFVKESGDRDSPQDGRGQGDHSDEEDDYDYPQLSGLLPKQSKDSPLDGPVVVFSQLREKIMHEDIYDGLEAYSKPAMAEHELYAQLKTFNITNILHSQVRVTGYLGAGCFGRVERGVLKKGDKDVEVALKTLNKTESEDKVKFLQEATLMAQFRHPNIINLLGVVSKHEPIMLVVELMHKGSLKDHLKTLKPGFKRGDSVELAKLLLSFSIQIVLGMQYLSARGFVHRDLAARNILVSKKNICKVADFGMSRDLADENYYVSNGGKIPVKWTAPEAILYRKYSVASDVWSYGCLIYEIWSLGRTPYETFSNMEVIQFLNAGRRLPSPPGCPRTVYNQMINCWNPKSDNRPKFRDVFLSLISNKEIVLDIPHRELTSHPLAGVLGSPLEAGDGMYMDLKLKYQNKDSVRSPSRRVVLVSPRS